jgi:hypothetical protein
LIRHYFADIPDPLPRWVDIKALVEAQRKGCEVHRYTFDEKRRFDPKLLAEEVKKQEMTPSAIQCFLQDVWKQVPACGFVYRDDFHAFLDDVTRELTLLITPPADPVEPQIEKIVPKAAPRAWADGEPGYSLVALRDSVLSVNRHFPNGSPPIADLRWMDHTSRRYFGFCRYSDGSITINRVLNSPDIPFFVMEFLMYHEMLHADMPYAGHNRDFRARERMFQPSEEALRQAANMGIKTASSVGIWRARADVFLNSFEKRWLISEPGMARL